MAVISRFFVVKEKQYSREVAILMPDDGDVLPITGFHTQGKVGSFMYNDEKYIVFKAALSRDALQDLMAGVGTTDPLNLTVVNELGIVNSYVGEEYSFEPYKGVYWFIQQKFGLDLSGEYDTGLKDEKGNPIMAKYLIPVKIAGE